MRWDALFEDLEAQLAAERHQGLELEAEEESELQLRRMSLAERLRAHRGESVRLQLSGVGAVHLVIGAVGDDWLFGLAGAQSCLVTLKAVVSVEGLGARSCTETDGSHSALGLRRVLTGLVRDRTEVSVHTAGGEAARGLLASVGADHIDVLQGEPELRRTSRRTVPLDAVLLLRSEAAAFIER
ncbi:hypothetical protein [Nesterenkonia sp. NBAIMH1]|uniref:hypothetical protein n=2 Tax=Nesterenkonia TaxID=57494 RepID=UPI0011B3B00F|nr:hypothetical protein [Nesterenkonia sp. NBAIMH1]